MGKASRTKGVTGERDIMHRLGGKRVGVAWAKNPVDVETDFSLVQVKNCPKGSAAILACLDAMPDGPKARYVAVKAARGRWIICETIEQHIAHHVGKALARDGLT